MKESRPVRTRLRVVSLLLIATGACGVTEYHQRMDAQRARIQDLDETNALLDDPVEMLSMQYGVNKELSPAWPFPVYLRLPKDFGTTPKDKAPYFENFPFFRYTGPDPAYSVFIAAAHVADSEAKQSAANFTAKNFRFYIRRAIEDYYLKANKVKLKLPEKIEERNEIVKPFVAYPDEAKPIRYLFHEYNDTANKVHGTFLCFAFTSWKKTAQVCIVEQRPAWPAENFDKAMKAALRPRHRPGCGEQTQEVHEDSSLTPLSQRAGEQDT